MQRDRAKQSYVSKTLYLDNGVYFPSPYFSILTHFYLFRAYWCCSQTGTWVAYAGIGFELHCRGLKNIQDKKDKISSNWFRYPDFKDAPLLYTVFNDMLFHWYDIRATGFWNCYVFLWGEIVILECSASNADVPMSRTYY